MSFLLKMENERLLMEKVNFFREKYGIFLGFVSSILHIILYWKMLYWTYRTKRGLQYEKIFAKDD